MGMDILGLYYLSRHIKSLQSLSSKVRLRQVDPRVLSEAEYCPRFYLLILTSA